MGGDPRRGDWGPTRDPKRNAQIRRQTTETEIEADYRREQDYLKHLEAFRERRRQQVPGMEKSINEAIPMLLGAWQQQVDNAITDAQFPGEDESQKYFWIALAGNLLWAATVFLNPAAAGEMTLIRWMSGVGATIGSGAWERTSKDPHTTSPPPHDPKLIVRQQVAKARGKLEEQFQKKRREWALGFTKLQDWGQPDDAALDLFNRYIWTQMFPWIKYDSDRFDHIRLEALEKVKGTLADYNRQWQQFKRSTVWAGKAEQKRHGVEFRPILLITFGGTVISGRAADLPQSKVDTKFH